MLRLMYYKEVSSILWGEKLLNSSPNVLRSPETRWGRRRLIIKCSHPGVSGVYMHMCIWGEEELVTCEAAKWVDRGSHYSPTFLHKKGEEEDGIRRQWSIWRTTRKSISSADAVLSLDQGISVPLDYLINWLCSSFKVKSEFFSSPRHKCTHLNTVQ